MTAPIILASGSASRKAMLDAAGLPFDVYPAAIDETAITDAMQAQGEGPRAIARALAEAKALAVSAGFPGRWVVGSDSMVSVNRQLFDKPRSRDDAAAHLRAFSQDVIMLDSSVALARDGVIIDWASDDAHLEVRALSDEFIETYLDDEWPAVASCVGCFRIEGRGVQLFENIIGNHFTILGMPLLPLLAMLRTHGVMAA
jgi:septum formation protein